MKNVTNVSLVDEIEFYEHLRLQSYPHVFVGLAVAAISLHTLPIVLPGVVGYAALHYHISSYAEMERQRYQFATTYHALDTDLDRKMPIILSTIPRIPSIVFVAAIYVLLIVYFMSRYYINPLLLIFMFVLTCFCFGVLENMRAYDDQMSHMREVIREQYEWSCNIYRLTSYDRMWLNFRSYFNVKVDWESGYLVNSAECKALIKEYYHEPETILEICIRTLTKDLVMPFKEVYACLTTRQLIFWSFWFIFLSFRGTHLPALAIAYIYKWIKEYKIKRKRVEKEIEEPETATDAVGTSGLEINAPKDEGITDVENRIL